MDTVCGLFSKQKLFDHRFVKQGSNKEFLDKVSSSAGKVFRYKLHLLPPPITPPNGLELNIKN